MLSLVTALALAAAVQEVPPPGPPGEARDVAEAAFLPDTVLEPPGGPRLVLLGPPGGGVAALRLSVPLREGALEAGAGRLIRDLALERITGLARPIGARVAARRTPVGLAYTVEGAAADFEYLAYLLREAVAEPNVESVGFGEAVDDLREELGRRGETPDARLVARLRRAAAPGVPPLDGTPASLAGMDAARVRQVWRRSHQASAMTLVVSAPVVPEVVLAATRSLGAPEDAARPPLEAPAPTVEDAGQPQTLRHWYGEAYAGGDPTDPRGPVAALLVARHLGSRTDGFESGVQLWELPGRWVLAVLGASYRTRLADMRRTVSGAVGAAADQLTNAVVADAVARRRRELLLDARTPAGLVNEVGRGLDATGRPDGAARDLATLALLDVDEMRSFFAELQALPPHTAEIRP